MSENINSHDIKLSSSSVVVVAGSNNPTILNPDFLYHNGIVPKDISLEENIQPITTPAVSQITFRGGFKIMVEINRVLFEQTTDPLEERDIICADTAKRYLKTVPHVPYAAIGINFQGYRVSQNQVSNTVSDALINKGGWMKFGGAKPDFQLKAVYKYDDKTITLDIAEKLIEKEGVNLPAMAFYANIHRDISSEKNQQMRINDLLSILNSYNKDLSDFYLLVGRFKPDGS